MAQEGQVVRNRLTGAIGVIRNGQVVPMDQQAAPAQAPVIAPPDPYKQQSAANDATRTGIAVQQEARQSAQAPLDQRHTELQNQKLEQEIVNADPSQKQAKTASALLSAAGIDLARGIDPVSDLIRGSTSGGLETSAANAYGYVTGDATSGMENIGKLKTIASDLTLQLMNGSLGTGVSNADRDFFVERIGNIADPNIPANQRLAAWQQVLQRMANVTGQTYTPPTNQGDGGGSDDDRWTPQKSLAFWGREYVTEDGSPLGPEGGYALDKATGEWGLVGRTTADGPTAAETEAAKLNVTQGEMGLTDLAGQGMTLGLSDEAAGIGSAISGALTGDFDVTGNYQLGRDAARIRLDQAREKYGWAGTGAEVLGGGALGKIEGGLNTLLGAGRGVAARGLPVTRAAIQAQMARTAAQEGALAGGVGGYGYGEGLEGSATNALLGVATGGALGFGGQRIGNALANRARANAGQVGGAEVLRAADELDIPVIPAVTGGTTARRLTSGARQGFISDRPIASAVDAMEAGGEAARGRIAAQEGRVLDSEDAGNVVRQAANVYSRRTSQIGGQLYDRADRMAGETRLALTNAVAKADEWLGRLAQSAEGTSGQLYRDVKKLRDQMAGRRFTVEGVRQTRTTLRDQIQASGLRGSATDKVFGDILEAASDDLFDGLTNAGKQNAANALRTANAFWKKRVETIDEVLEPILGKNAPRSGEQIVTALERLANPRTGNTSRLRKLFSAMPRNEAQSVSATIISRLGQPTAGAAQSGAGFSFDTFLTNWNKMSPRARAAMFSEESRAALDKLATVAKGVKQAGGAMNRSNTAGALGVQAAISAPLLWLAEPMTAIAATGGQWAVGRLLASPRVARWVAGAPSNPQARNAYIARLGGIARAEPALANEIGLFERAIRAANDNAGSVTGIAAQEPDSRQR